MKHENQYKYIQKEDWKQIKQHNFNYFNPVLEDNQRRNDQSSYKKYISNNPVNGNPTSKK